MRKFLIPILFYALYASSQVSNQAIVKVGTAPSGACVNGVAGQLVIGTGAIYTCQNNLWAVAGAGSGVPLALPNGSTATTQTNPYDASTNVATDAFVVRSVVLQMATTPISGITGGTYSFDSQGTGALVNYAVSGGAITSITTWIPFVGSGYAIGDVITPQAGNYDALIVVTGVSGTVPNAGTILYGGTGYTAGTSVALTGANAVQFTFLLSGTLTSNATFIMPYGSYLTTSNQWFWANNTTGAFTVSVCQAGNTNACSGGRSVAALPQGTNNSCIEILNTDGILNVDSIYSTCPSTVSGGSELTVTALSTPVIGTITSTLGGGILLHSHLYYYRVAAIDSAAVGSCAGTAGTTLPATEASGTTGAGADTYSTTVPWAAVTNATGYCVFGRTTGGELLMTPTPLAANVLTFTDNGSVTPSGALPGANTTGNVTSPTFVGAVTGTASGNIPTTTVGYGTGSGNYTSASVSFVSVDATNLLCPAKVIPVGSKLFVWATGSLGSATAAVYVQASLYDSQSSATIPGSVSYAGPASAVSDYFPFASNAVITGDGNSHTIYLQYLTSNASDSVIMINSSATIKPTIICKLEKSN